MAYMGDQKATITISVSPTTSNAVDIRDAKFVAFILPTLDTCNITFTVALTKTGDYVVLKDMDGGVVTLTVTTGECAIEFVDKLAGFGWIKIVTSEDQLDDRVISVLLRT